MARDKRIARGLDEPQGQQEEMTVILLKFRGDSQTLQKGFDVVSQAISALGSRPHHGGAQRQSRQLPPGDDKVIDVEEQHLPEGSAVEDLEEEASVSGNGKGKKPPSVPKYTFMDGFNISPEGVPSLTDYCTEKEPQTVNDKFLVASAWLQTRGGADPFTGQHLFTCFRAMKWDTQVDMAQPLRQLKSDRSYYENPSRGQWRLTTIGLQAAESIKKE
jgi:hypothetical protein